MDCSLFYKGLKNININVHVQHKLKESDKIILDQKIIEKLNQLYKYLLFVSQEKEQAQ
jgi:hypothetical protein